MKHEASYGIEEGLKLCNIQDPFQFLSVYNLISYMLPLKESCMNEFEIITKRQITFHVKTILGNCENEHEPVLMVSGTFVLIEQHVVSDHE